MAQKNGLGILFLSLFLLIGAVECQWGLGFGWFWGNLEDLKTSEVESGVVKSSSHIPGTQSETPLLGDGESSSEEDLLETLSSVVGKQKSIKRSSYRSRDSMLATRKKRIRKNRRRNKNMQRRQKYRKSLQAVRKRYNDYVRRKYGKLPQGTRAEQTDKLQTGHENSHSFSQSKKQTSVLEELVSASHDGKSILDVLGKSPDTQTSNFSPSSSQRNASPTNDKTSNVGSMSNGIIETTTTGELEAEYENETETTDAPEQEGQTTVPTTITTELTTQETEYEQEYYENTDMLGFGPDVLESYLNLGVEQFENNENNSSATNTLTQKSRALNTQASPLKSNDVAAKDLEKTPQSMPYVLENDTESLQSVPNTKTGIQMQESSMPESLSKKVDAPSTAALSSQIDNSDNNNAVLTSQNDNSNYNNAAITSQIEILNNNNAALKSQNYNSNYNNAPLLSQISDSNNNKKRTKNYCKAWILQ
uniref:Uncharacterized protein DDB_G0288805-like n=1 Tax=Crassostrea virginica TaxID=6565 RepID=A0A8B8D720_CRAVI|nr:uncharacterized protein DDB_G0288805-like [Crassostrea virginica]